MVVWVLFKILIVGVYGRRVNIIYFKLIEFCYLWGIELWFLEYKVSFFLFELF